jgi:predicted aconitase with swiveling domain
MIIKDFEVMVPGTVTAEALASNTPLSFWGGVNVETGEIQDVHHDLCSENMAGKVLCIPYDRGSCSGSGMIFEMIRQGSNPAAILCIEAEAVLALGPVIGRKVYGRSMPIRTVSAEVLSQIHTGDMITFEEDSIRIN